MDNPIVLSHSHIEQLLGMWWLPCFPSMGIFQKWFSCFCLSLIHRKGYMVIVPPSVQVDLSHWKNHCVSNSVSKHSPEERDVAHISTQMHVCRDREECMSLRLWKETAGDGNMSPSLGPCTPSISGKENQAANVILWERSTAESHTCSDVTVKVSFKNSHILLWFSKSVEKECPQESGCILSLTVA